MNEISTKYNPKETEDKWYKLWEEKGYFHAAANSKKKPYSIVIPPPNVTAALHTPLMSVTNAISALTKCADVSRFGCPAPTTPVSPRKTSWRKNS